MSKTFEEVLREDNIKAELLEKSKSIHFEEDGPIVITDPSYVLNRKDYDGEVTCFRYGSGTKVMDCIIAPTLCGDWSCTTYKEGTREKLGEFCADSGTVGVFSLKELIDNNKDKVIEKIGGGTMTLIPYFQGDVWFETYKLTGVYDNDTSWHKKGDVWTREVLIVVGKYDREIRGGFYTMQN